MHLYIYQRIGLSLKYKIINNYNREPTRSLVAAHIRTHTCHMKSILQSTLQQSHMIRTMLHHLSQHVVSWGSEGREEEG